MSFIKEIHDYFHPLNSALRRAASRGDILAVTSLIRYGASVDAQAFFGDSSTPLMLAAERGYDRVVRELLERGADANRGEFCGRVRTEVGTPLTLAAKNGYADITSRLINFGANVNQGAGFAILDYRDGELVTPLMWACAYGRDEVTSLLVERRADADARDGRNRSALGYAIDSSHVKCAQTILKAGADPNVWFDEYPLMHLAIASSSPVEIVTTLIEVGANLNQPGPFGTPMGYAASWGKLDVVRLLLEAGADAQEKPDYERLLPRDIAIEQGYPDIAKLIDSWDGRM